jgi:hypothetical protein
VLAGCSSEPEESAADLLGRARTALDGPAPADCPVHDAATDAAALTQLHTVFAGVAVAAGLAAVAALVLLRGPRVRG